MPVQYKHNYHLFHQEKWMYDQEKH